MLKHRDTQTQTHRDTETHRDTDTLFYKKNRSTDRQTDRQRHKWDTDIHTSAPMMSNSTVLIMSLLATATHNAYKKLKI